jgi:hypothetical protein
VPSKINYSRGGKNSGGRDADARKGKKPKIGKMEKRAKEALTCERTRKMQSSNRMALYLKMRRPKEAASHTAFLDIFGIFPNEGTKEEMSLKSPKSIGSFRPFLYLQILWLKLNPFQGIRLKTLWVNCHILSD